MPGRIPEEVEKRVGGHGLLELCCGPGDHPALEPELALDGILDGRPGLSAAAGSARKDGVAALEIGAHIGIAEAGHQATEPGHVHQLVAADVDAPQQGHHPDCHRSMVSPRPLGGLVIGSSRKRPRQNAGLAVVRPPAATSTGSSGLAWPGLAWPDDVAAAHPGSGAHADGRLASPWVPARPGPDRYRRPMTAALVVIAVVALVAIVALVVTARRAGAGWRRSGPGPTGSKPRCTPWRQRRRQVDASPAGCRHRSPRTRHARPAGRVRATAEPAGPVPSTSSAAPPLPRPTTRPRRSPPPPLLLPTGHPCPRHEPTANGPSPPAPDPSPRRQQPAATAPGRRPEPTAPGPPLRH